MDEKSMRVTMTLTVAEWQEIIAGLTGQSFNGRKEAEALNQKIASFVAAVVQTNRETPEND